MINTYNGDGLRVSKSVNGSLTRYLYEYDKVVLEVNYLGDQTGRNVYGINLLTRQVGADTFTYMYNGHADVTALLSITGLIAATYYYDAFGNILDQTGSVSNNILYAGYQYDTETGLYYLNARMYDPVTARFMQEDTYAGEYGDPLSLNLYTYCKNEPIRYSDPTGHRYDEGDKSNKDEKKLSKAKQQVKTTQHKQEMMEKRTETPAKEPTLSTPAKETTITSAAKYPSGMPSSDYNQFNVNASCSLSNIIGTQSSAIAVMNEIATTYFPYAIANSPKPNNIGAGQWAKIMAQDTANTTSVCSKIGTVSKMTGYAAIAVDVGFGVYDNVQVGASDEKIVSDAVVDTSFGLGGLGASTLAGFTFGTVFPGFGNVAGAAGAFTGGLGYMRKR